MPEHHPPHLYLDRCWYVISASTLDHLPLLHIERAKTFMRDKLRFQTQLRAWVILDNHYHLLLRTDRGLDLARFIGRLHGSTSRQINLWDGVTERQVWHNYWDTCIWDEVGLWTRFNYIHNNPVKHGYVRDPVDWPFSSYGYYLRTKGPD
jgi:putative transposase